MKRRVKKFGEKKQNFEVVVFRQWYSKWKAQQIHILNILLIVSYKSQLNKKITFIWWKNRKGKPIHAMFTYNEIYYRSLKSPFFDDSCHQYDEISWNMDGINTSPDLSINFFIPRTRRKWWRVFKMLRIDFGQNTCLLCGRNCELLASRVEHQGKRAEDSR